MFRRVGTAIDSNQRVCPCEQAEDVVRSVREEVARVLATIHTIHTPAAVGVDQTSEEVLRMLDDKIFLPPG